PPERLLADVVGIGRRHAARKPERGAARRRAQNQERDAEKPHGVTTWVRNWSVLSAAPAIALPNKLSAAPKRTSLGEMPVDPAGREAHVFKSSRCSFVNGFTSMITPTKNGLPARRARSPRMSVGCSPPGALSIPSTHHLIARSRTAAARTRVVPD